MLRIPYVPTAYPDEILASLFTRLVRHSGTGLWRSLLEHAGYGRRTISPFFATPMREDKLDRLLGAVGYSYPAMLRELSVIPFWLAFTNATDARYRINIDPAAGRLTELTRLGRMNAPPGARYCPNCLVEDLTTFGEPYVHRSHQLPVATVCATHGTPLRVSCPACEVTVLPLNRSLLRAPTLHCQCGHDLSIAVASSLGSQESYLRLSQFAADALSSTAITWTGEQVHAVLEQRTGVGRRNYRSAAISLLREAYGDVDQGPSTRTTVTVGCLHAEPLRLNLGSTIDALRSPELCALLSAAGLTFEEFKQAAASVKTTTTILKASASPLPLTLEQAQGEFETFEEKSLGRGGALLLKRSPHLFWLLRIHGSAILKAHGYDYRPIPTAQADRDRMEWLLRQGGRVARGGPWYRLLIRDPGWLEERSRERRSESCLRRKEGAHQERTIALSRAVFSALQTEERPARIHAGLLARFAQISMYQAQAAIARSPSLQQLIKSVNAGKDRRLAFWAAKTLLDAGQSPSASDVLLRAGLNTTRVNRQYCQEAIECLTSQAIRER